jgi:hypothetical protein
MNNEKRLSNIENMLKKLIMEIAPHLLDQEEPNIELQKKPKKLTLPDPIDYETGLARIVEQVDFNKLVVLLEVKKTALINIAKDIGLNVHTVGFVPTIEEAKIIWRLYCAKRGW